MLSIYSKDMKEEANEGWHRNSISLMQNVLRRLLSLYFHQSFQERLHNLTDVQRVTLFLTASKNESSEADVFQETCFFCKWCNILLR